MMKKLILITVLLGLSYFVQAQSITYKAFKVDLDFGYAIPSNGTGTKAGATFTVEPHYRLTDNLAVGLRIEGAGLGYESDNASNVKVSLLTSYAATAEYYLMKGDFRPFIGAGAGFFHQRAVFDNTASGGNVTIANGATKFGYFPRVGIETGHLRLSATYDVLGNNSNYSSFTIGFFFGGGRKR